LHPSGVVKSSTSFGWGKGGKVTAAGWQVTLCDPTWYVISGSGEIISTKGYIRFTLKCSYFAVCRCRQDRGLRLDIFGQRKDVGSADAALAGEMGPPSPRGWASMAEQSSRPVSPSNMPRGYREDGTAKDQKPSFLDSLWQQKTYSSCK